MDNSQQQVYIDIVKELNISMIIELLYYVSHSKTWMIMLCFWMLILDYCLQFMMLRINNEQNEYESYS